MKLYGIAGIIILIFGLVHIDSVAQSPNTASVGPSIELKGKVVDSETDEPLEYATVSVYTVETDELVTGGITNDQGTFSIMVKEPGNYNLKIEYVSYIDHLEENVTINPQQSVVDVGNIEVAPDAKNLDEVIVEGDRMEMIMELDKRIFNVAKDLSNTGRNARDILDNLPSVTVDVDGNVSLRGSQNVRILVDGKPSGLIGIGDTDGLRTLSGDLIETIEVITNPSARYDAEGMAGIINIILKKKRDPGLNGSFTGNAGYPQDFGGSVNMNFRKEWVNLFVNYGINYRKRPGQGSSFQEFFLPDTSFITRRTREHIRGGISNHIRFGSDFIIDDNNTITASFQYRTSDEDNKADLWYEDFTSDNSPIERTLRQDHEGEDEENYEYEIDYKRTFQRKGQELSATVQFENESELESSDIVDYKDGIEPILFQRSTNDEGEVQWLMQADYIHPFGEDGKFEVGYKGTVRTITNSYLVEEQDDMGTWIRLDNFSNTFEYDENIYAGYVIAGNKTGNWSYQVGLRVESTDLETKLFETQEFNRKVYTDFFPSAFLTFNLTEQQSLQGSYSRRLSRPRFWYLNPFFTFSDNRNIRTGNPDLDPEYTDSYELGYLINYPKGNIYLGGYYRYTEGVISRISTVDQDGITYSRPENLNTEDAYGLELTGSQDIGSWFTFNGNVNFYRAITSGFAAGEALESDTYTASSRLSAKMNIPNVFELQLSGFYRAPQNIPQGRRKSMYSIDLGITKDILNKNGTLTLSGRDLLNTRKYRGITSGPYFYQESEFQWRSRQVTLSFTYRLNQKENRRNGRNGDRGFDEGEMEF